ncbi:hypothetical protein D9619_004509 [Psilocybe cf. subviscida]|uniref:DUF7918 domain-containing protein n=1 Tax=Psilocybe cf. subviscida TaxID=2480587 RepID=A0A8H5BPC9_9AGAR|nr:hypothetical protein D9619_004509 [Psilocybe cf. subviscida]
MMENTQLEFGGLRSFVVVDGTDVPQYGVQYDEGSMEVTSWIVSEPDKPFSVHADLMNRIHGENYAVRVFLDGHKASGSVIRPADLPSVNAVSIRISPTETQRFMFGSLELSDDDALLEASSAKALGEIKILFYRVGTIVPTYNGNYAPAPQAQKVHERAKKGLAHSVKYGGTQLDPLNPAMLYYSCSNETLLATHLIRYRPLAMLQANGIVPYAPAANGQNASNFPSPAPGPSSSGNPRKRKAPKQVDVKPVIVLSDDDDEDIVKRENHLKEQLAQVQKQKAQLQGRPVKRVKQEGLKPILPGEVIDLTL